MILIITYQHCLHKHLQGKASAIIQYFTFIHHMAYSVHFNQLQLNRANKICLDNPLHCKSVILESMRPYTTDTNGYHICLTWKEMLQHVHKYHICHGKWDWKEILQHVHKNHICHGKWDFKNCNYCIQVSKLQINHLQQYDYRHKLWRAYLIDTLLEFCRFYQQGREWKRYTLQIIWHLHLIWNQRYNQSINTSINVMQCKHLSDQDAWSKLHTPSLSDRCVQCQNAQDIAP